MDFSLEKNVRKIESKKFRVRAHWRDFVRRLFVHRIEIGDLFVSFVHSFSARDRTVASSNKQNASNWNDQIDKNLCEQNESSARASEQEQTRNIHFTCFICNNKRECCVAFCVCFASDSCGEDKTKNERTQKKSKQKLKLLSMTEINVVPRSRRENRIEMDSNGSRRRSKCTQFIDFLFDSKQLRNSKSMDNGNSSDRFGRKQINLRKQITCNFMK